MMKSARGMAPWSKHANKAHTDFLRIPGNRDTLHTVSYTHLDVYKRQQLSLLHH